MITLQLHFFISSLKSLDCLGSMCVGKAVAARFPFPPLPFSSCTMLKESHLLVWIKAWGSEHTGHISIPALADPVPSWVVQETFHQLQDTPEFSTESSTISIWCLGVNEALEECQLIFFSLHFSDSVTFSPPYRAACLPEELLGLFWSASDCYCPSQPRCTAFSGYYLSCSYPSPSTQRCGSVTQCSWDSTCSVFSWNGNLAQSVPWSSWQLCSSSATAAGGTASCITAQDPSCRNQLMIQT